jgi:hypothetical protein
MQDKISAEISRHSMSIWRYSFQISEESLNPLHFDRNPLKRNNVLTEEKLDDNSHRLENFPWKSLQGLVLQSGVSVDSAWTATRLLHIHLHKIAEIKPMDYEKRVRFCNWFISHVHDWLLDPKLTVLTDEA